jgi:hypothetical protein
MLQVPRFGTGLTYLCSVKLKQGGTIMNKNIINTVNRGDKICATLECNGHRLAAVNGIDFTSLEAVKRALLDLAGHYVGMAVLTVRNCTQGWRDVTALATMRRPALSAQRATMPSVSREDNNIRFPWAS